MDVDSAIEIVKKAWDTQGACASCGFHAALYEYGPLEHAISIDEGRKRIELSCMSGETGHRGVRIYYNE